MSPKIIHNILSQLFNSQRECVSKCRFPTRILEYQYAAYCCSKQIRYGASPGYSRSWYDQMKQVTDQYAPNLKLARRNSSPCSGYTSTISTARRCFSIPNLGVPKHGTNVTYGCRNRSPGRIPNDRNINETDVICGRRNRSPGRISHDKKQKNFAGVVIALRIRNPLMIFL